MSMSAKGCAGSEGQEEEEVELSMINGVDEWMEV